MLMFSLNGTVDQLAMANSVRWYDQRTYVAYVHFEVDLCVSIFLKSGSMQVVAVLSNSVWCWLVSTAMFFDLSKKYSKAADRFVSVQDTCQRRPVSRPALLTVTDALTCEQHLAADPVIQLLCLLSE